jgi:antitoxin CptB
VERPLLSIDDDHRVYWHSRRGMLELDLVLMPFAQNHYSHLSVRDKQHYVKLLACEDQDLFGWFLQHRVPEDPDLHYMVQLILEKHHGRSSADSA